MAGDIVPWELQPITAEQCAKQVWHIEPKTFLQKIASRGDFPAPCQLRRVTPLN